MRTPSTLTRMSAVSGGPHVVLVDANILFSRTLRDWLFQLCLASDRKVFDLKWTEDIVVEVLYNIRETRPDISGGYIAKIREHIENIMPDGKVTQYQVPGTYQGKDQSDAHVHAAAEACRADILLTENVKDFRLSGLESALPYEVQTADEFFTLVDNSSPSTVREVTLDQVKYFYKKHREFDLCAPLTVAGAPSFANRVRGHLQDLGEEIHSLRLD